MSRATLAAAFAELQDGSGCVAQSRLRELLTRAGWAHSSYSAMRALVPIAGATHNDVIYLLRSLGHTDRAIGDGKLAVTLAQVAPFFLSQCAGQRAPANLLLVRPVIGAGAPGFHTLPAAHAALGRASASETAPPVEQLMQHTFMPKDLPPRPATAYATRLRALTHGAPSAAHTSAASLFTIPTLPSSGDTGYLDTSRMGSACSARLGELPAVKDTRSSALLRATRAAGVGAGGAGGVLSAREARVVLEAEAAERAGGASARAAFLATHGAQRPSSARNYFAGTARRVPTDGRPGSSIVYSSYAVVGGSRR